MVWTAVQSMLRVVVCCLIPASNGMNPDSAGRQRQWHRRMELWPIPNLKVNFRSESRGLRLSCNCLSLIRFASDLHYYWNCYYLDLNLYLRMSGRSSERHSDSGERLFRVFAFHVWELSGNSLSAEGQRHGSGDSPGVLLCSKLFPRYRSLMFRVA